MRIALYGLPCAGKTSILKTITFCKVINGSEELKKYSGSISEKRAALLLWLNSEENKNYFIDGHFQFVKNGNVEIAFTDEDKIFDVFMYLYQEPSVILDRISKSEKNQKYLPATIESISSWQNEEISKLREICHKSNKDFYIIDDYKNGYENFIPFCMDVLDGFSNLDFAKRICNEISFDSKQVTLLDGDKTITKVDTSKTLLNFSTDIFDNNFYTGYQFWIQDKIIDRNFDKEKVKIEAELLEINTPLVNSVKNPVIISSGLSEIWNDILGKKLGIKTYAGKNISSETKYFLTKFLKQKGYKVISYGDSKNDLYMLKESDKGILVINKHLSRSLKEDEVQDLEILNYRHHFLNEETYDVEEYKKIKEYIAITKSDSGINGNKLAKAHFELGGKLVKYFSKLKPNETTIVSFERSGHFLADGIFMNFDARFVTYNSKFQDFPKVQTKNVILVDGVINNGNTILKAIEKIQQQNFSINIFIATNVINKDALIKFNAFNLVAVRSSSNKFVGSNVKKQIGNVGPDTSDRLFNFISSFSISELELSINNKCNLQCFECGFLTPNQPKPTISENIIEEHYNCLKILENNDIEIESLAILGGEPTLNSKLLEEALIRFSKLNNIKQIELVTNGLLPQNISEKTFSLIDKISISLYIEDENFIKAWENYVQIKAPCVKLCFRNQKKWDLNSGTKTVSREIAQRMFENCWYKEHCVAIERSKLFLCSVAAKNLSDADGLLLTEKTTLDEILGYILRKNQLNHCCRCIPEMKLGKIKGGQQCGNANLSKLMDASIKYMNSLF